MDISTQSWESGFNYSKDDIVKIDDLTQLNYGDPAVGQAVSEIAISANDERDCGGFFPVNPRWNYSAKAMVKKGSENAELIDNNKTFLTESGEVINLQDSIGVGIGIKFYDSKFLEVIPNDRRNTYRLLAQSELSHLEYYSAYLDIKSKDIPSGATLGRLFVFVYGHKAGEFKFRRMHASTTNPFFYCIKEHESSETNYPGSELWNDTPYWTQDFEWRPSYGSKSNFVAINENLDLGEGSDYVNNLAINSLPLEIDVSFNNRTDKEAKAIMHFLQEKHFAYESIFGIDYRGDRLLSGDVSSFRFVYTHPYRKDLHFTCTDFSHSILYRNNNVITAKFVCNTESSLRSVDSHAGYNDRLDALINIFIDKETKFVKGQQIKLNTFSLEESESEELQNILNVEKISNTDAKITFSENQSLEVGDCIFIEIAEQENSVFNVGLTKIIHKINDRSYVFGPVLDSGSDSPPQSITIKHLNRCPGDCLISRPLFPDGVESIQPYTFDPVTGKARKRVVVLKNYRKLQIDSVIELGSTSIVFTALSDFTLDAKDDFQLLIPAVNGRHSIYLEDPDRVPKFPWLKVRSFEQRPSLAFELSNSPDTVQSDFIKYYNKKYKKQINQNLNKFTVVFDQRDDEEALEILQFLESHLGYKKFRFDLPRPYLVDQNHETSPSKPGMSTFFCPSWDHEIVYKNNHKITATFIESVTSIYEDLSSVFGIGKEEDKPCYSAHLQDPITPHKLCTFSSGLQAATCGGFSRMQGGGVGINLKNKVVDIVFIVDTTLSTTSEKISGEGFNLSKFDAVMDTIRKMVVAYDGYIMPGTESYGGLIDAPEINFVDISGDNNSPPWAVDQNGNSLLDSVVSDINKDLKLNGFNANNFDRFNIKIDKKRVNIGIMLMGRGPKERTITDLSTSSGFDKSAIYKKTENILTDGADEGEYFAKYIAKGMAQMYNSPRAEYVSDRIMIMLSDGIMSTRTSEGNNVEYVEDILGEAPNTYSFRSIEMCKQMRYGRDLAKRRPTDEILSKYGNYGYKNETILKFLNDYKYIESDDGKSLYYHPDNGVDNPDWYEERLNTVFISMAIGVPGDISNELPAYVYDYDPEKHQDKKPEFYFEISSQQNQDQEVKRLINLIRVVEDLSGSYGYENLFSVTVHNCGPNDVEIKNTLINIESETEPLKWTTEKLKSGIPKGGSFESLEYTTSSQTEGNSTNGNGGQYYGDPNNKRILSEEKTSESNILWESFNTKYEVYRDCSLSLIDGGWKNKPSNGVENIGVASKGMPIRVFGGKSNIQIIDYNIANVNEENSFRGDYSHLPKLKVGESLDLFFGIRVKQPKEINENIQLIFNTDDGTINKTDCYAEIKFPARIEGDSVMEEIIEPIELQDIQDTQECDLCCYLTTAVDLYNEALSGPKQGAYLREVSDWVALADIDPGELSPFSTASGWRLNEIYKYFEAIARRETRTYEDFLFGSWTKDVLGHFYEKMRQDRPLSENLARYFITRVLSELNRFDKSAHLVRVRDALCVHPNFCTYLERAVYYLDRGDLITSGAIVVESLTRSEPGLTLLEGGSWATASDEEIKKISEYLSSVNGQYLNRGLEWTIESFKVDVITEMNTRNNSPMLRGAYKAVCK